MSGRRIRDRFALARPWEGYFQLFREVTTQRSQVDELTVISQMPCRTRDVLRLHVASRDLKAVVSVDLVLARLAIVQGSVRHQLRLRLTNGDIDLPSVLAGDDVLCTLERSTPVSALNIGTGGCLLETECAVEPGTTGVVALRVERTWRTDDVRVTRCQNIEGAGGRVNLGAQFLWTMQPGPTSLRRFVFEIHQLQAQGVQGRGELAWEYR